jgi:hypothetical protein
MTRWYRKLPAMILCSRHRPTESGKPSCGGQGVAPIGWCRSFPRRASVADTGGVGISRDDPSRLQCDKNVSRGTFLFSDTKF